MLGFFLLFNLVVVHIAKTVSFKIAAADLVGVLSGESSHSHHCQCLFHLQAEPAMSQCRKVQFFFFRKCILKTASWTRWTFVWGLSSLISKGGTEMKKGSIHMGEQHVSLVPWLLLSNEHGGWCIFSEQIVEDIWPSFLSDAAEIFL